ncbi:hypothetical protein ACFYWX_20530 [Streptomyces sp. NPDC002888]|uniref:hypothetical protein n=1 Tax=Streptomyces sp. NPDC002888 TaxID=3364668 RepID=UPI0036A728C8
MAGTADPHPPAAPLSGSRPSPSAANLLDPSAHPADEPLDEEHLELYTAWAVALDAAHSWERAITDTTTAPRHRSTLASRIGPALAVGLVAATLTSSAAQASSGGGGGGGGDVGGGSGGGGGGSW